MRHLLLSAALLFLSLPCMAQEELVQRLADLNQTIEITRSDVAEASRKLLGIETELKDLAAKIATLEVDQTETTARVDDAEREQARLEVEQSDARRKVEQLEALSLKRIRALYTYEGQGNPLMLLSAKDGTAFSRGAYYLTKVRKFDADIVREIEAARVEAEQRSRDLVKLAEMERSLRDTLAEQRKTLKARSDERQKLRSQLIQEQGRREELLTNIRTQALRLETVLASLTNAGIAPEEIKPRSRKRKQAAREGFSSFSGSGLESVRGRLPLPLAGSEVVQRFTSKEKVGGAKGITLRGPVGEDVGAVAAGKILFVGKMPELGTVVVIDHGERSYSLYGLLGEVGVGVGDEVDRETILGKTLEPSRAGGNLYFEIRRAGMAVDPLPYFSRK